MRTKTQTLTPHAFVSMVGSHQEMVFDLGDEADRQSFLSEIVEGHDWDWQDEAAADSEPWLTVALRPMPSGYAASLPEHAGW